MFHHSYSSAPSYRTPVSQINSREKYLAALAKVKAAEADAYYTHTPAPQYSQAAPLDLDALHRQIAAEEHARIVREQEVEALRVQEAQRKAQELEALRIREERRAQLAACDLERSRALASAQNVQKHG
ncbi:hypothetical protein B0H14DRAFT_3433302 [Mycena olivaceomarginata]|nr:hypothetical protein B0H14DRAFT_3433302 [Mycena olivaceomarginata]